IKNILITFGVLAALNIGMRQLIHQHDRGFSREDGIDIHLGKDGTFVLDLLARDDVQLGQQVGDALASMGLDYADNNVLTATVTANALAQHAVGLAHAGSVAEKQFENSLLL